jgi:hypothetical protein
VGKANKSDGDGTKKEETAVYYRDYNGGHQTHSNVRYSETIDLMESSVSSSASSWSSSRAAACAAMEDSSI